MNFFALIARIINGLLSVFDTVAIGASMANLLPTNKPGTESNNEPIDTDTDTTNTNTDSTRCKLSIPEVVNPNARFRSIGSGAWIGQWEGTDMEDRHGGTDYTGPPGTSVYAPFAMTIITVGHYNDSGRYGDYIIGTPRHDTTLQIYMGHLNNIQVSTGDIVECGAKLGQMNIYAHTHVQIKRNGAIIDPESILV